MANFAYLSPEWAEEGRKRAEEELTPEKLHHVTSSMTNHLQELPRREGPVSSLSSSKTARSPVSRPATGEAAQGRVQDNRRLRDLREDHPGRAGRGKGAHLPKADAARQHGQGACGWRRWWTSSTRSSPPFRPTTDTGDDQTWRADTQERPVRRRRQTSASRTSRPGCASATSTSTWARASAP